MLKLSTYTYLLTFNKGFPCGELGFEHIKGENDYTEILQ